MNLYTAQFSADHDFPDATVPNKFLIIASTPRCGSHMLGHVLHATGRFGFPLEYALPANLKEWQRRLGVNTLPQVLGELQRRRTSSNGVFSVKVHYDHIRQFGGFKDLLAAFPNAFFVLLSRKDVLRQAVSYSLAKQTGSWIAAQQPLTEKVEYSYSDIDRCLRKTLLDNAGWRYLLNTRACNFIELNFETMRNDIPAAVMRIAEFMKVTVEPQLIPGAPVTTRQGDETNLQWREQYLRDYDGRALLTDDSKEERFLTRAVRRLKSMR